MKRFLFCLLLTVGVSKVNYCKAQAPSIRSFTPMIGRIGSTVTITGNNFSANIIHDSIYFGPVKATVLSATSTSLTVKVPAGAFYQPISVICYGLTCQSNLSFSVTFDGAGADFTAASFAHADTINFASPGGIVTGDFDGDGKTDFGSALSFYRNTSTADKISFAPGYRLPDINDPYPHTEDGTLFITGDIDGDGKPEAFINYHDIGGDAMTGFENTSTNDSISFTNFNLVSGSPAYTATIIDVNNDGHQDIVVASYDGLGVNPNGHFDDPGNIESSGTYSSIAVGDIDGDGKPEIIAAKTDMYSQAVNVYLNTPFLTASGFNLVYNLLDTNFQQPVIYTPYTVVLGDLDGDGKLDAVIGYDNHDPEIYRNTSTPGKISFEGPFILATNDSLSATGISIIDLNGDGKPEIIISGAVYKNISVPGTISFATGVVCIPRTSYTFADFNADGKPDVLSLSDNTSIVFSNSTGNYFNLCEGATTAFTSNFIGSSYQWEVNSGSGFTTITNNSNYSGAENITLQLNNIPPYWYGYQYRCLVDGDYTNVYNVRFADTWTGASDSAWENFANWSCFSLPDSNTDVIISAGNVVLHSNATIRSLTLAPGVNFTVSPGNKLTIIH